jgi:hypothetical protein
MLEIKARNPHFHRVKGIPMEFGQVYCSTTEIAEYPQRLQREIAKILAAFVVTARDGSAGLV